MINLPRDANGYGLDHVEIGALFWHPAYQGIWVKIGIKASVLVKVFDDDTSGLVPGMTLSKENMPRSFVYLVDLDIFIGDECVYRTWEEKERRAKDQEMTMITQVWPDDPKDYPVDCPFL